MSEPECTGCGRTSTHHGSCWCQNADSRALVAASGVVLHVRPRAGDSGQPVRRCDRLVGDGIPPLCPTDQRPVLYYRP